MEDRALNKTVPAINITARGNAIHFAWPYGLLETLPDAVMRELKKSLSNFTHSQLTANTLHAIRVTVQEVLRKNGLVVRVEGEL